jgi:hypothetical protein
MLQSLRRLMKGQGDESAMNPALLLSLRQVEYPGP